MTQSRLGSIFRRMKHVGVIGAGAAGLCAARHILANQGMVPIVWEQSEKVGGTWNFTPQTGTDKHGLPIHSSMYQNLKTNLPKEVMAFPDFPFPEGDESFLHHSQVQKYLEIYTEHFDLYPYIKFSHHVEEVKPIIKDSGPPSWSIKVKDLNSGEFSTTVCDALLVCNGHYSIPRVPVIKDIENFKGSQIHSHNYREPSPYTGNRVVVLGASASGLDIMLELAPYAKEVLLSHNLPVAIPSDLPSNVRQVRGVVAASENGFIFGDGTSAEADIILYCTGYEYTFPFLTKECNVTIEDNVVKPLYKHLIHSTFPSLAFIGIPFQICPFPLFDFQVQFFVASVAGRLTLPSPAEMAAWSSKDLEQHRRDGHEGRHYHRLGLIHQLPFLEDWAEGAKIAPPGKHIKTILYIVGLRFILSHPSFKKSKFTVQEDGGVIERRGGAEVYTKLELTWLLARGLIWILWRDFPRSLGFLSSYAWDRLAKVFHS
ncbi:flavin-containing monooxygenase FMO GS-OX5-like isoform X1 [Penaeus chinensis]|uniref:flavin-containing monooxygenase FMO GS-OX5-like isoform X1 n=2 Tax=Penaeus chinensis TaxID=139456 RepID=UPI001FB58B93|nr:flavin-containing monooxygenase FMO GS-OX5-like isoform X1 [Penaeus chinensis]